LFPCIKKPEGICVEWSALTICHDLWASALTIFQAVYTTRDGVWVSEGGGRGTRVGQGTAGLKGWSAAQVMSIVASWNMKAAVKLKLEAELCKNKVDGAFLARLTSKNDRKKLKGLNLGLCTALWTNLRPYLALPMEKGLYDVMTKVLSPQRVERFPTASAVMAALRPLVDLAAELNLNSMIPLKAKEEG
jgi:hypothetical protein